MGIPSGNIGRVIALHVIITNHDILEDLIKGSPQMDISVGIGWSVMENKLLSFRLVPLQSLFIQIFRLPILQHLRFLLGKSSTHGKIGLRQIQRRAIIYCHCIHPLIPVKISFASVLFIDI